MLRLRLVNLLMRYSGELADEIQLAGAHLVKDGDVADKVVARAEPEPLADEEVRTDFRAEVIIFVRIASRFLFPELVARDGGQIQAAIERFHGPAVVDADAPRDVVLLHGECGACASRAVPLREESPQEVGLPLAPLAIVPSGTYGKHAHPAGVLQFDVRRLQAFPTLVFQMYTLVPASCPAGRSLRAGRVGGEGGRGSGQGQQNAKQKEYLNN